MFKRRAERIIPWETPAPRSLPDTGIREKTPVERTEVLMDGKTVLAYSRDTRVQLFGVVRRWTEPKVEILAVEDTLPLEKAAATPIRPYDAELSLPSDGRFKVLKGTKAPVKGTGLVALGMQFSVLSYYRMNEDDARERGLRLPTLEIHARDPETNKLHTIDIPDAPNLSLVGRLIWDRPRVTMNVEGEHGGELHTEYMERLPWKARRPG